MTNVDVQASEKYQSYLKGFRDAVGMKPIDPKFQTNAKAYIAELYAEGWAAGRKASHEAASVASTRSGHRPTILRLQEEKP